MNKFGQDGWDHSNHLCSFGITEAIFGVGIADALGGGLLATGAADALGGAAVGAAGSALTGANPLTGALTGGLTGGLVGGLGGLVGDATGLGAVGGDALVGAGAGALGSGLTGQNPITGALEGGVGGAVAGFAGAGTAAGSPAAGTGGPGAGAGAIAAPSSVVADATGGVGGGFDVGGVPAGTELAAGDAASLNQQLALGGSGSTTNTGLAIAGGNGSFGTASDLSQSQLGSLYAQGGGAVPGSAVSGGGGLGGVGGAGSADLSAGGGLGSAGSDLIGIPPAPPGAPPAAGGAASGGVGSVIGGVTPSGSLLPGAANVGGAAGGVGSFLGSNANWLLPAAVLGYDALKSGQGLGNIPGYNQLSSEAGSLSAQGQQLAGYLQSGTLPPGVQTSLNQAATAAQATIKSQYAARGMSGSSAEATDLANVQNTIASQGANIATQLLQTGISEQNLSSQLYSQILNANLQNDNQLGSALTTLAAGAARPTITVNQGG